MSCTKCELHKTCRTVNIRPDGRGDIVFLGEAPGSYEDSIGKPFVGDSGKLLRQMVDEVLPEGSYRFTHAVRCRPPQNKAPAQKHINACLDHLIDEFVDNPPRIIIPLGNVALNAMRKAGLLKTYGSITQLHGKALDEQGLIVLPMLHPAYVLRNPESIQIYAEAFNNLEKIVQTGEIPKPKEVDYDFSADVDELKAAIDHCHEAGIASYDIETSVLHPREDLGIIQVEKPEIMCFSLSWKEYQGFGFVFTDENRKEAMQVLHRQLLENPKTKKNIQHAKFEIIWSQFYGYEIKNIEDPMLLHWHVDERKGTHGLGRLSAEYTDMGFYDSALEDYKENHREANPEKLWVDKKTKRIRKGSYKNIPIELLLPYNCADTDAALRVRNILKPMLTPKQLWVYENVQIPATYALADMELKGVPINWAYVEKFKAKLEGQIVEKTSEIFKFPEVKKFDDDMRAKGKSYKDPATGEIVFGFNPNSAEQVGDLLFKRLRLPPVYKTKKGANSTDKYVMAHLAKRHDVPNLLTVRRGICQNLSTFVVGIQEDRRGDNIHANYLQIGTESIRYSCRRPNLQNQPRDADFRRMYVPEPPNKDSGVKNWLVQFDYSQIELKILAIFSKDKNLMQAFRDGVDVHTLIASKVYKKDVKDVTKDERTNAKRTIFGIAYGQGPEGLAEELGCSLADATELYNSIFAKFPGMQVWKTKTENELIETGQVATMFGTVRRLPEAQCDDEYRQSRALRQGINLPIQGTAGVMFQLKHGEVHKYLKDHWLETRILLTVYDSIIFSIPDNESYIVPEIKKIMEDFSFADWVTLPITVDCEFGESWGDLLKLDPKEVKALGQGKTLSLIFENRKETLGKEKV